MLRARQPFSANYDADVASRDAISLDQGVFAGAFHLNAAAPVVMGIRLRSRLANVVQVIASNQEIITKIAVYALEVAPGRMAGMKDFIVGDGNLPGRPLPPEPFSSAWLFSGL